MRRRHVLLVSGSTRAGSVNTAVLRTAPAVIAPGATTELYDGLSTLPAFNPDDDRDPLSAAVRRLRDGIRGCSAVLFCTPEYAGALPGSFKNLLDWTVGDDSPGSIYGKPVGWLNVSSPASPSGGELAHASLATVLGYVGAVVVDGACRRVPTTRAAIGPDGLVVDPAVRSGLASVLAALVDHDRPVGGPASSDEQE